MVERMPGAKTDAAQVAPDQATHRPVISSAKLIALCTLASRVTGLARDVLLAQAFALSWVQDAFSYAFQIPNLFRRLFGEGGLAPVFVPTFTKTLETEGRESAWRLLARTLALLTTALVVSAIVVELAIAAAWFLIPADPELAHARRLLLGLTALMLPFMISICILALLAAILNCVGSFVPAALAPIVLNLCMIAAIVCGGFLTGSDDPQARVYAVAVSVLVAGGLQLLLLWPALHMRGVKLGWRMDLRDPTVKRMLRLMPPVALGQGVLAFGVFLDAQICVLLTQTRDTAATFELFGWHIAYPLSEGALSAVTYAQRLYQFPLGVLAISLATAALPAFSRLANREDWTGWAHELRGLLRFAIFEGVLAGAMMIVLAEPIVRFLFEYGNFTAADTARTARVLAWYGVGLWAFCAQHIILRGFYSLHDANTPLRISCAVLPVNVILNVAMVWLISVRESAFAISSALTYGLAVVVGAAILQRRHGQSILDGAMLSGVGRMALAGGASAAAVFGVHPVWAAMTAGMGGPIVLQRALSVFGLLGLGCTVFVAAALLLGLPEARLLFRSRRR